ncbi:hypothetical protein J4Q44_G00172680 [Coregonus suidteri]|uniref:Uncharacterized protein n=1 Tax=Coregonus suidteri TaxID=861788 RepID=A0AAN8LLE7_9TELE
MIFSCIKFIFIFLNTLFWVSGLALVLVGAMSWPTYTEVESFTHMSQGLSHTSILLIVVGIIVSLLAFLGSIGAWSNSRLLLGLVFTGFLMLILSL